MLTLLVGFADCGFDPVKRVGVSGLEVAISFIVSVGTVSTVSTVT